MHNNQNFGPHLNSFVHLIRGLPQGHEKPLKHALYNAVALLLLCMCCAAGYALFLILDPFFKPLLWALLVGSLLHPIKYSIATRMRNWFYKLETSKTPFILGTLIIPIDVVNNVSKFIGGVIHKYYKVAGCIILSVLGVVWFCNWFPWGYFGYIWKIAKYLNIFVALLLKICNTFTFLTLVIAYFITVHVMWNAERESLFRKMSLVVWLCSSGYISHLSGSFQTLVFISLQVFALFGLAVEAYEIYESMKSAGKDITMYRAIKWTIANKQHSQKFKDSLIEKDNTEDAVNNEEGDIHDQNKDQLTNETTLPLNKTHELVTKRGDLPTRARAAFQTRTLSSLPLSSLEATSAIESHIVAALHRKAMVSEKKPSTTALGASQVSDEELESTLCFKFLFWACAAVLLWKHIWIWPLILIVLAIYIIKTVGKFFGVWLFLEKYLADAVKYVSSWWNVRYSAIVPAHVKGIFKIMNKLESSFIEAAKGSIDSVSTILVIVGLILFLTCAPIFMGVQIYSEGITVVQLTGSLINRTIVNNPEMRQLLPPGWDDTVDSLLDNAYLYGREGLSKAIKGVLKDTDSEKSAKLENQLLELWDRIYQTWMSDSNTMGPQVNSVAIEQSWKSFKDHITKTPEMFNTSGLMNFAKQNIGTLLALLDSLWSLLKGNITLVLGSVSAITSVLLGGSTAVLNFLLGLVVFFTTLFYLLNSSTALYKPIEIISNLSPINGSRFGLALTDAVNGVFKATLKMAIFYGLWTWLIHNLFGAKIVYLPSALAAILAAVPFLGTYLACIPAVLDLWLAQGSPFLAILLAVCQFAPASYVDTIIYKEIKNGGHPYFTGLAIAGGIFCLGAEGAIFGPLLLCCLLVALNLSSSLFTETPMEEQPTPIQSRLSLQH